MMSHMPDNLNNICTINEIENFHSTQNLKIHTSKYAGIVVMQ